MGVVVPVERLRKHPCPPAIQYVSWMDGWIGGWMEGRLLGRRVQDSTSGMASAGRIEFHVRSTLPRAGAAAAARTDTRLGHLHGSSHLAAPGVGLAGCQLLPRHAPPRCRVLGSVTRPLGWRESDSHRLGSLSVLYLPTTSDSRMLMHPAASMATRRRFGGPGALPSLGWIPIIVRRHASTRSI